MVGTEVLAQAFFLENKFVQAFPAFGVERRGAPVTAFCRVDDSPIYLRNNIYLPDHVVVLDASLLESAGVTQGLKKRRLCRDQRPPRAGVLRQTYFPNTSSFWVVDASAVALEHGLGSASNPIVNTAILGAFAKATGLVRIESVGTRHHRTGTGPSRSEQKKRPGPRSNRVIGPPQTGDIETRKVPKPLSQGISVPSS